MSKTMPPLKQDDAFAALRSYAATIAEDPQTNSVLRLAQDYFFALSSGDISSDDLQAIVSDIGRSVFDQRAGQLADRKGLGASSALASCSQALKLAADKGWDAFQDLAETPRGGIVFTAHPTFANSRKVREALAAAACGEEVEPDLDVLQHEPVSLVAEHEQAQSAIAFAQKSAGAYLDNTYAIARETFPDQWKTLNAQAPTIASWVAYDLDGRDDIRWWTTMHYRLAEKAAMLERYIAALEDLAQNQGAPVGMTDVIEALHTALSLTRSQAEAFNEDLSEVEHLVKASNLLTESAEGRFTDLAPIVDQLRSLAAASEDDLAQGLLVVASQMDLLGLGTARIHLRINASQVQTVIRRDLGLQTEDRILGRVALETLATRIRSCTETAINFADLFLEQSTARRQFMLCAQILKHVDSRTPIRFLIAESENPATVLGALYFARQYGVADMLDISPLFETPDALEDGARFISRLLDVPEFSDYVRGRGQLSIQLGFSDAGRFIGQIAADMAIERIHNLIATALASRLPGVRLCVFNTHGESVGRGGYPGDFSARLNHLLSPWTHARCAERGVSLMEESSFQGGDGYLHFGAQALSDQTYGLIALHQLQDWGAVDDPFYTETSFVWDFYRALRGWQEALFDDESYGLLLSDFAGGFQVTAGSRPKRRSGGPGGPRSLRAISHNATLHQLSALANTACGIGSALPRETGELADLINRSPRLRHLIDLAVHARIYTSIPALRAYATAFSPSFWVACSKHGDSSRSEARTQIALALRGRGTATAIMKVADHLSIDLGRFDQLISMLSDAPTVDDRHETRLSLHVLHAVRIAIMMRAIEIAAEFPAVSARHGFDIEEVRALVFRMQLDDAADLLSQAFPLHSREMNVLEGLSESRSQDDRQSEQDYARLQEAFVRPLRQSAELIKRISLAITHVYGAHG